MKNYAKVIGFILLLFFCSFQSNTLADDSFSPGSQWQEIPAYGPELAVLADWQDTSSDGNTTDFGSLLGTPTESVSNDMDNMPGAAPTGNSATGGTDNMLSGLMGMNGMDGLLSSLGGLMGNTGTGGIGNMLGGLTGGNNGNLLGTSTTQNNTNSTSSSADSTQCPEDEDLGKVSMNFGGIYQFDDVSKAFIGVQVGAMVLRNMPFDNSTFGVNGPGVPVPDNPNAAFGGATVTADFDPSTPGRETKYWSPLILDTDHSGAIALDGGTIPFDIAPHIAGLETIPVPAAGKDMFLVWDKAGTETIEGAEREYKEGEIVDITELFGPEDYSRSDFSKLAYTDDGFTKLAKLCDVNKDGHLDKQDTALSAEVAAKLKLWSPLSGELILFKDTDIVIDVRAGSYERHPSDIEGWAVEYKMKDAQDNLVGYEWLTSRSGSLLCVDVLLAVQ